MIKVLITGGNGFIGSSLGKLLASKSINIINPGDVDALNLCDWEAVRSIPKSDVIVHLASKNFVPASFNDPQGYYNNNIASTINILEKAKADKSKVIFFSTYVYGPPLYLPVDENHYTNPLNPYTQSKLICEELCKAYHRDFGLPVTIFRPFNIYGPGQNPAFFIPTIINQIKNKVIQLNDSRPKRDFIHVDDVCEAVFLSITNTKHSFSIYNLGSGVSTSVKEIVNMILKYSHSKAHIVFSDETRQGEVMDTIADISKIKLELNWEPKISISKGLEAIVNGLKQI